MYSPDRVFDNRHSLASYHLGELRPVKRHVSTYLSSHFFLRLLHVKQPVCTLRILAFGCGTATWLAPSSFAKPLGRHGRLRRVQRSQGIPPLHRCLMSAHRKQTSVEAILDGMTWEKSWGSGSGYGVCRMSVPWLVILILSGLGSEELVGDPSYLALSRSEKRGR